MSALLLNSGLIMMVLSIGLCVHAWRTGQDTFWLFIILFLPPLGGLAYLAIIVAPSIFGGSRARQLGQAARATLDPGRGYRAAQKAHEDAPTVANKIRLASAAAELGRWEETEQLYREGAQGIHAEDPTLLLGQANALVELGRFADAVPLLDQLAQDPEKARSAPERLVLARAYEGLGRMTEAESAYRFAVERLPGLEAIGRYGAFLARVGRTEEARETVADMDRRIAKLQGPFRQEGRAWRNLAAEALG